MYKWFQIGAFCFQLTYDDAVCIPEHFLQFQVKEPGDSEFVYRLRIMHSLPALVEKILLRRPDLTVYQTVCTVPGSLWPGSGNLSCLRRAGQSAF